MLHSSVNLINGGLRSDPLSPIILTYETTHTMKNLEVSNLISRFGTVVTSADLHSYADEVGVTYQTLTKKLDSFKVQRGLWHLTAIEQLENALAQPAVEPMSETPVSFIPKKDGSFVSFGNFADIKKVISVLNKLVLNLSVS